MLLGGAALTRTYVERDLREVYKGRLFYGKDAFEGLRTMETLMEGKRTRHARPRLRPGARRAGPAAPQVAAADRGGRRRGPIPARSDVAADNPVFKPPFLGSRVAKGITLDDIAGYLNETALFRNQWQFRPGQSAARPTTEFKDRIRPMLRDELAKAKAGRHAGAGRGLGLLPGQRRRQRPGRLDRRQPHRGADAVRLPPPAQGAAAVCIADFFRPADHPARPTTPPSTW